MARFEPHDSNSRARFADSVLVKGWKSADGGGKTYRVTLGGGKTYYTVCPPESVLEGSESGVGLICARSLLGK